MPDAKWCLTLSSGIAAIYITVGVDTGGKEGLAVSKNLIITAEF